MMLSGNLTDWSVGDLLQMLHITKKTASLHVDGVDRSGVVYFEEGAIVNAIVSLGGAPTAEPRDEVVEAVYVLELLDEGTFEIKSEVPPRMIEPLVVSEALELAGQHLNAERHLDETGLLSARGLRLAQTIDEPIILSEQVWNAISVSIPAFTFPALEERLGRAAAVATVEQFRDLGILEAVLEDVDPAALTVESAPIADIGLADVSEDQLVSDLGAPFAESWTPPGPEASSDIVPDSVEVEPDHESIVPDRVEEVRPIVAHAPDESIVVPDQEPASEQPEHAADGVTAGVSSLSAAIRAAAEASAASSADDESRLLSEAAGDSPAGAVDEGVGTGAVEPSSDDGSLRRTVKSLVSPPETALVSGVLGDLGSRFRHAASADRED